MSNRKVLIITYYWPPSGGAGVQRWMKFSKYLPEFGWEPIIYTPESPSFGQIDNTLLDEVPEGIRVIKKRIFEPYTSKSGGRKQGIVGAKRGSMFSKFKIWIRGNLFIPDPRIFWVRPSIKTLKDLIASEGISHVVTTGPPHSMHLIGLGLKKHFQENISWIADFRDVWSRWDILDELMTSSWARAAHLRMERLVTSKADQILTVNNKSVPLIENTSHILTTVITNGYDPQDFENLTSEHNAGKFRIAHFGLLNDIRNPTGLWKALGELLEENEEFQSSLEVHLGGMVSDSVKDAIGQNEALKKRTHYHDYLPHMEVLNRLKNANVLLLAINQTELGKNFMTGKVFEFIPLNKPVLSIGPTVSDASRLVMDSGMGHGYENEDTKGIKGWLLEVFNGKKYEVSSEFKLSFDRKKLTGDLVNILNRNEQS